MRSTQRSLEWKRDGDVSNVRTEACKARKTCFETDTQLQWKVPEQAL